MSETTPTQADGTEQVVVDAVLERPQRSRWGVVSRTLDSARSLSSFVSRPGWHVAAIGVVCSILGGVFRWDELLFVGVGAGVVFLLALIFVIGRNSFEVTLDLANGRTVVGQPAFGRMEFVNTSNRPAFPVRIELPVGNAVAIFRLPRLAGGRNFEELFTIPTSRRGVFTVGPVRTVRGDALGLLRRAVVWTDPKELIVHPRTVHLSGNVDGFIRDVEGHTTQELSSNDVSFHALREYVPGDDRRAIHWKTTARIGKMMVRQFEETKRSHVAVGLSCDSEMYSSAQDFELAIAAAGSIGAHTLHSDRELTSMTERGRVRSESAHIFLDELARLESTFAEEISVYRRLDALAQALTSQAPQASVAFMVTGDVPDNAALVGASQRVPVDTARFIVCCREGVKARRQVIGDLIILRIGAIEDLPALIGSVSS